MNNINDNTPIIIGIGQVSEVIQEHMESASSNADLAAQACKLALDDALNQDLSKHVDTLAMVRTFPDSSPAYKSPFGGPSNMPRAVARRIDANPNRAIYGQIGGHTPQAMINEFAESLASGEAGMVLLTGAEVIANTRVAAKRKTPLNWSEKIEGSIEDRGMESGNLFTASEMINRVAQPMQYYALMENARRADKQQSVEEYAAIMGENHARLSKVAKGNPLAAVQEEYDAQTIITPSQDNPMVIFPYTKKLISKDTVNLSAAVLMTTVAKARELGIDQSKWVFLHGYSQVSDKALLQRENLGTSVALKEGLQEALKNANKTSDAIQHFDLYSCFPIVVAESKAILGISEGDPRSLTQTGGMSFFGGPGNNYNLHGVASLVSTLRSDPGSFGLALGNGGWMSKITVGVYSTTATENWQPQNQDALQARLDSELAMEMETMPDGEAVLDSFTAHFYKGQAVNALVVGRLKENNKRFYAILPAKDSESMKTLMLDDPIGKTIYVESDPQGNRFAFDKQRLAMFRPPVIDTFMDDYQFCSVEKEGAILRITMNRPEVGNALHPPANAELEGIMNAFENDDEVRVAILTGAGEKFFCTGNDLKYMAQGNAIWVPKTGFAGITNRANRTKPIIAAVNGSAMGGGLEIAMAADIIVAADHAKLALPEVKVGLIAGAGGIQRLTRQIGLKPAMRMLLSGKAITAEKALALGLVNEVVPLELLIETANEIATEISHASPAAVKCTMKIQNETARFSSADDAVAAPHTVMDELINSADFWDGPSAFAEKRKPIWIKE